MKNSILISLFCFLLAAASCNTSNTAVTPSIPYAVPGYIVLYGNYGDTALLDTAVHWNSGVHIIYQSLPYVFDQIGNGLPPVSIHISGPQNISVYGLLYISSDTCSVTLYPPSLPFLSHSYTSYR